MSRWHTRRGLTSRVSLVHLYTYEWWDGNLSTVKDGGAVDKCD